MHDDTVAAAYDARAAEYIALLGSLEQLERADETLISRWCGQTSGVLLDAGCGPGVWCGFLADAGRDVVGVDICAEFLATARARHPGVRYTAASMRALPFPDETFGGVLAWYSLIHLPPEDLPAVLAELARVLTVGGRILIGYFDGAAGAEFPHAVIPAFLWSAEALTALLEDAGLNVLEVERREPRAGGSARPHGALIAARL